MKSLYNNKNNLNFNWSTEIITNLPPNLEQKYLLLKFKLFYSIILRYTKIFQVNSRMGNQCEIL